MHPTLLLSRQTRAEADRWRTTTSAHLRQRARDYRLAAAVADCPREEVMFCDLAMMFDQLAYEFRRFENDCRRASVRNEQTSSRTSTSRSSWLARLISAGNRADGPQGAGRCK